MKNFIGMCFFILICWPVDAYSQIIVQRKFPYSEVRDTTVTYVIIHDDESKSNKINQTFRYLRKKHHSYHYYISRLGIIYKLVDPQYKAMHAGYSSVDGLQFLNDYSIGICFQNDGTQRYTSLQYSRGAWLIDRLQTRFHNITKDNILGHKDIAIPKGRKRDPGKLFNWKLFKSKLKLVK